MLSIFGLELFSTYVIGLTWVGGMTSPRGYPENVGYVQETSDLIGNRLRAIRKTGNEWRHKNRKWVVSSFGNLRKCSGLRHLVHWSLRSFDRNKYFIVYKGWIEKCVHGGPHNFRFAVHVGAKVFCKNMYRVDQKLVTRLVDVVSRFWLQVRHPDDDCTWWTEKKMSGWAKKKIFRNSFSWRRIEIVTSDSTFSPITPVFKDGFRCG